MTVLGVNDSLVNQAKPSTQYGSDKVLKTRTGGAGDVYALVKPSGSLNQPGGATAATAKLRLYLQQGITGSVTFTARLLTSGFNPGTVKWSNKPTSTATGAVSVVVTDKPAGSLVEFDVSTLVGTAVAAGVLHGFEVRGSGTTVRFFHSANSSTTSLRPNFEIVWFTKPNKPSRLTPSNGLAVSKVRPTFVWDFVDPSGLSGMRAYELQLKYGSSSFSSPDVSTGVVVSGSPSHTFGADLSVDTPFFWRVRNQNQNLEWSDWSDPVESVVTAKSALSITAPTADVSDLTPPIVWSFAGTQTSYQVIEWNSTWTIRLQDSGVVAGTDTDYTFSKPLSFNGGDATVEVRVWDDEPRVGTPGDPAHTWAYVQFGFEPDPTVDPVTDLTATVDGFSPTVLLAWSYASVPDAFAVYRDGVLVDRVDGPDVWLGGTSFEFTDATGAAGAHSWEVFPVVNNAQSDNSPIVTGSISGKFAWLYSDNIMIPLVTDQPLGEFQEQSETVVVSGATRTLVKTLALRGREGTMGGVFDTRVDMDPVGSLSEFMGNLMVAKQEPVRLWRLMVGGENIPVIVRNVSWAEVPGSGNQAVAVSFEYFQQGELGWSNV